MIFSSYRDFSLYSISIQNQCNSIHMNKQKNPRMHLFGMTLLIWSLIGQFDFFAKSAENIFFYQHSISIWTSWALLTKKSWIHPPSVPLSENPCAQASKSKFPNTNNLSVNCYLKAFLSNKTILKVFTPFRLFWRVREMGFTFSFEPFRYLRVFRVGTGPSVLTHPLWRGDRGATFGTIQHFFGPPVLP